MQMNFILVFFVCVTVCVGGRTTYSLDQNWRFELQTTPPLKPCPPGTWTINLNGKQTLGLHETSATSESVCAEQCCNDPTCETYQFCDSNDCGAGPPQQPVCWIGRYTGATTQPGKGWIGKARVIPPVPPTPPPQPGAVCSEDWCKSTTDDSQWRRVSVPHDFVVEGNFSSQGDKSHGFLPFGVGLYRKRFSLPVGSLAEVGVEAGAHSVYLHFDGAQTSSQVYLNDEYLGSHASGYTPFQFLLTGAQAQSLLQSRGGALLAVKVDATQPDGWWYDGGGLYRHVKLVVVPQLHLALMGGAYLPSTVDGAINIPQQTADSTLLPFVTLFSAPSASPSGDAIAFDVSCVVTDSHQKVVGSSNLTNQTPPPTNTSGTIALPQIKVVSASLWSPDSPFLYTAVVSVVDSATGTSLDEVTVMIGFRQPAWSPNTGFTLNGVPTKIRGTANHQDFAGVGVAVPDSLQAHRINKLKEMGCNGWRTAHNAPTEALLDAADRLGFLVWDENHRNGQDDELTRLVLRDRNHPSIVIWSICNEKLCDTPNTLQDGKRLHDLFHTLDPHGQRVVSANYNDWSANENSTPLDLQGVDYATGSYDERHSNNPHLPMISSETSSAVSDRAIYTNDPQAGHVRGYDTEYPGWGQTAEGAWGGVGQTNKQGILTRGYMSGGFTWTGWDYKGEPTPDGWPDINSHFGILDIAGFPKDRFYWYQAWFKSYEQGKGMVHLFPHWNWDSNSKVEVWAYSNGAEVELFVNGKSFGRSPSGNFSHAVWKAVPYTPGNIKAVAYDSSNVTIATQTIETTGEPAALEVSFKDGFGAKGLESGCNDVALVMVKVVDAQGNTCPTAKNKIILSTTGTAVRFLGGGNGDPAEHTADHSLTRPAFGGLLLGVFGSTSEEGAVVVTAKAEGLVSGSVKINVVKSSDKTYWCPRFQEL